VTIGDDAIVVSRLDAPRASSPAAPEAPWTGLRLEQLSIEDLELAGVARSAEAWRAFVHAPVDGFFELVAGQDLEDGRVRSVGVDGVVFERAGGEVVHLSVKSSRAAPDCARSSTSSSLGRQCHCRRKISWSGNWATLSPSLSIRSCFRKAGQLDSSSSNGARNNDQADPRQAESEVQRP